MIKSKPLSQPAICGSNMRACEGSLLLPSVGNKWIYLLELEHQSQAASRAVPWRWNEPPVTESKQEAERGERNLCPSLFCSKDVLNQVWQLTAPWQLGSVKGKVAQVLLRLWLHRCSGAAAHCSIKGDYRDRAICHLRQNKREPFYVSACMFVCVRRCVCVYERKTENPSCRCTFNLKGSRVAGCCLHGQTATLNLGWGH